ncbi:MAG TPA: sugar transferase [Phycisphaerae bacterium]|nr:sugar transferase [Phycisphaerae bacterium]
MNPWQRAIKRIFDVVVAGAVLLVGWPFLAALAVLIRIDSPRPVLFRQERAGRHMQPFTMLKFRTMRPETPPYGLSPRSPRDPRLTRVGRFLRETGLDELPQLWNVLKGEMSLVGPRPLYMRQARVFTPRQRRRLEVRPGLTGLAQVQGRGEVPQEEKLEIDVHYVEQMSLALDLSILCQTVLKGFGRQKGYETW